MNNKICVSALIKYVLVNIGQIERVQSLHDFPVINEEQITFSNNFVHERHVVRFVSDDLFMELLVIYDSNNYVEHRLNSRPQSPLFLNFV